MKKEIPMSKVNDYLEHMAKSRAKVLNKLQNVSDDSMTLPIPNRNNMYVRSMFYRFISHEVEHTIHLAKTLTSLGIFQSEAEQILKQLAESRGKLIGMISTLSDDELDSKPSPDDWSPREIVDHILEVEESSYTKQIVNAIEN